MGKNEMRASMLESMDQIAAKMPDVIFDYYDKIGNEKKYVLSMAGDAFKTIDVFCYAISNVALTQAALILRQLLEQVSIVTLLVNHPEILPKYIEHFKFRQEHNSLIKHDLIDAVAEHFQVKNDRSALIYLDYGWIPCDESRNCCEDEMIRKAGFEDIVVWRKTYLDKLAHASYTSDSFLIGDDFPIVDNFIEMAAKLFDYLCVAFHNLTKFDYVFDGSDLFNSEFKPLYMVFNQK